MGAERVDLEGQAADFRWHLEHAEPGSALEECARWGLGLVAELRVAREAYSAVVQAVDKFERDLGFTAPELWPMRLRLLREAIEDAYDRHDPPAGGDHPHDHEHEHPGVLDHGPYQHSHVHAHPRRGDWEPDHHSSDHDPPAGGDRAEEGAR
jgi:hypothetical protein